MPMLRCTQSCSDHPLLSGMAAAGASVQLSSLTPQAPADAAENPVGLRLCASSWHPIDLGFWQWMLYGPVIQMPRQGCCLLAMTSFPFVSGTKNSFLVCSESLVGPVKAWDWSVLQRHLSPASPEAHVAALLDYCSQIPHGHVP